MEWISHTYFTFMFCYNLNPGKMEDFLQNGSQLYIYSRNLLRGENRKLEALSVCLFL